MTIKLSIIEGGLSLKILNTPNFNTDKTKLSHIYGRKAVWDGDTFSHWFLSRDKLGKILSSWNKEEILCSPEVQELIDNINIYKQDIKTLEKERVLVKDEAGRDLFDYQEDYIGIPRSKKRIISSFLQGLGKTMASLLKCRHLGFKKILVIGPVTPIDQAWPTDIQDTLELPHFRFKGKKIEEIYNYQIVTTNYEKVGKIVDWIKEIGLKDPPFDHIIIDEIHNLSNPETQTYKTVKELIELSPNAYIQGLSGTPMRLHMKDLHGCLYLLFPELVGNKYQFVNRYEEVLFSIKKRINGRLVDIPIKTRTRNEDELKALLDGVLVRVKRENVVKFKDTIEIVSTPLTPRQANLYKTACEEIVLELESGELKLANALTRMLRLLQIGESEFNIDPAWQESSKLDYVRNKIETYPDKIVVWSRFKPMSKKLKELYPDKVVMYNSDVPPNLKKLAVWAFNGVKNETDRREFYRLKSKYKNFPFEPGEAKVFAGTIHLKSALGLNLEQAHYNIFTSYDWNCNAVMQAKDRIARITQQSTEILTEFLVAENTIEGEALKKILSNYAKSLAVLDGKQSIGYNTTKQLMGLLR